MNPDWANLYTGLCDPWKDPGQITIGNWKIGKVEDIVVSSVQSLTILYLHILPETFLFGHKLVVNRDVFHGENLPDSEMSVDLHQDLVGHVFHFGGGDVLLDSMDQVLDTELFCQGEKVGEILLSVDTIQAKVVIIYEVDEQTCGTDSDAGKINNDILDGLDRLYFRTF